MIRSKKKDISVANGTKNKVVPVKEKVSVEQTYNFSFLGKFKKYYSLTKMERDMVLFLEEMDKDNQCLMKVNGNVRRLFISLCRDYSQGKDIVSDSSVRNVLARLVRKGILINAGRSHYQFDSEYYWHGDLKDRDDSIRRQKEMYIKPKNAK